MSNNNKYEPSPAAIAASKDMKLDVKVYPVKEPKNNVVAFSSVTLSECFAVTGIKIVDGEKGLFVAMPSAPDGKRGFRDTCFPLTADLRKRFNESVLSGYAAEIGKTVNDKESIMGKIKDALKTVKETPTPETVPGKEKPAKTAAAEL
jgi:DNA-binding cell septation regulator SpoVG